MSIWMTNIHISQIFVNTSKEILYTKASIPRGKQIKANIIVDHNWQSCATMPDFYMNDFSISIAGPYRSR